MIKIIIVVFIGLFLILLIKQFRPEYSYLIRICAIAVVLFSVISGIELILDELSFLIDQSGIDSQSIVILTKVLGISIVVETAAETCRDCSETALASKVELVGKLAITALALPIIKEIINLCVNITSN